jgi:FMN-dependent NADH-azoreductase
MPTLLHLDSSPMGEQSVSRDLSQHFTQQWLAKNPGGRVITRDLSEIAIAPVDLAWVAAIHTPTAEQTSEQKALLTTSEAFLQELKQADEYVFGVPMHNFSIPSSLKLWIDQICRPGETFSYVDGRPKGLLVGKKATVLMASGGMYDEGTAMASLNHVKPYLQSVLGFIGITDLTFLATGGTMALRGVGPTERANFLEPHFASIQSHLASVVPA